MYEFANNFSDFFRQDRLLLEISKQSQSVWQTNLSIVLKNPLIAMLGKRRMILKELPNPIVKFVLVPSGPPYKCCHFSYLLVVLEFKHVLFVRVHA